MVFCACAQFDETRTYVWHHAHDTISRTAVRTLLGTRSAAPVIFPWVSPLEYLITQRRAIEIERSREKRKLTLGSVVDTVVQAVGGCALKNARLSSMRSFTFSHLYDISLQYYLCRHSLPPPPPPPPPPKTHHSLFFMKFNFGGVAYNTTM